MKIKLHEITVRDVADGYVDSAENGVVGYGGRLNIRPAFQREFIYKEKQRNEVIHTVMKNFPLNVMYWVKSDDGHFELLDGQQRTISLCQYVANEFSVMVDGMPRQFENLTDTEQAQICKDSVGIVSKKTILKNHPFVENADDELVQLEKEEKEAQKKADLYGSAFNAPSDDPKGGDGGDGES